MRQDWISCDGFGRAGAAPIAQTERKAGLHVSRRNLLVGLGMSALAWTSTRSALAGVTFTPGAAGKTENVLVTIFLRGGADGLSLVIPYAEDAYHRVRPNVGLPSPNDRAFAADKRALDLNGFFGLNPALAPLLPLYHDGQLAAIHAAGSFDETRSHFEAMATMERGLGADGDGPSSGWVARHLSATESPVDSPLRAVAFGSTMPDSLRGAMRAVALQSVADYRLNVDETLRAQISADLGALYGVGKDEISHAGHETLAVLETLRRKDPAANKPENGAVYPDSDLGRGLREVAGLIRADVGMEVACLDKGGWDSHVVQGATVGLLPTLLDDLGKSIAAFAKDLGPEMRRVTVVVMSEFGRRVAENNGLGTDHGHGGAMFLLGGGVKGGQVHARWPGLEPEQLTGAGDLKVTTDYRDVLGEILGNRFRNSRLTEVFAGHRVAPVGLVA